MQKLVISKHTSTKLLNMKIVEGSTIVYIGDTLSDIWLDHINEYIKWALDPEEFLITHNVIVLEKKEDYIYIGSQLSDRKDGGPFYTISIDQFIKILPKWKELIEANAQTITITDNKGTIEIYGN